MESFVISQYSFSLLIGTCLGELNSNINKIDTVELMNSYFLKFHFLVGSQSANDFQLQWFRHLNFQFFLVIIPKSGFL